MERKNSCPSLSALEEYAVALTTGTPSPTVHAHLQTCKKCQARIETIRSESDRFLSFLRSVNTAPATPCPEPTLLAAYLDNALSPEERENVEQHAALCRQCQQTLKQIYKETRGSSRASEGPATYGAKPTALNDRKRTKRRPSARPVEEAGGDTADGEPRKKRLSSDFD